MAAGGMVCELKPDHSLFCSTVINGSLLPSGISLGFSAHLKAHHKLSASHSNHTKLLVVLWTHHAQLCLCVFAHAVPSDGMSFHPATPLSSLLSSYTIFTVSSSPTLLEPSASLRENHFLLGTPTATFRCSTPPKAQSSLNAGASVCPGTSQRLGWLAVTLASLHSQE